MNWKQLLESASDSVNDDLRLRNDYLMAENRILRNQIDGRVELNDSEGRARAEIGAKLGKLTLEEIATVAQPDTILAWNRKFANQKVDTSEPPKSVGRPRVNKEIEDWVIRMARENRSWGYDRIQGSSNHLGYTIRVSYYAASQSSYCVIIENPYHWTRAKWGSSDLSGPVRYEMGQVTCGPSQRRPEAFPYNDTRLVTCIRSKWERRGSRSLWYRHNRSLVTRLKNTLCSNVRLRNGTNTWTATCI